MALATLLLVGAEATATAGATAGIIGAGGAVTAAGLFTTGAAVGGAVLQATGARQSAKAEVALFKYRADLDRREAGQRRTASLDEQRIRREQLQDTLKRQRAGVAKAGFRLSGSPLEQQLRTAQVVSADIATLAFGRELEATGVETRAGLQRFNIQSARQAGRLGVGGAITGGISDIATLGIRRHLLKQGTA